MSTANNLEFNE